MTNFHKALLDVAKIIQETVDEQFLPPAEITPIGKNNVVPHSLFRETRGYLERIVFQINTTYEQTCYDGWVKQGGNEAQLTFDEWRALKAQGLLK